MERTYTLHDVLAALRRRRWVALLAGAAVLALALAFALLLPSEYTASSTVQIEPRRLPVDFFPAQAIASFEDRMRTVKHGILARPVLERVVKETDFFPDMHDDLDGAIEKLRRQVEVRLEGEVAVGPPALLFVVEVRGRDPRKVRQAADLLPRAYEALTREVLQGQARALRETLDAQAKDTARALAAGEQQVLAYKLAHGPELPEMVDTNARAAARAEAQLEMHLGAIVDARRRRTDLLTAIPEGLSAAGMAEAGLDAARRKVAGAEASYGDEMPDVRRARREYDQALAVRDEEEARFRSERLQRHVGAIDGEIRQHQQAITGLERELATYQQRVEAAPRRGQELSELSRDYDALRAKYAAVVSRREDAAAAEALLARDAQALFRTVEPASEPARPSSPDRMRLAWLGLLAAVASGLAAAAVSEWMDGSLRGPEDAGALGVPVLAAIPRIGPRKSRAS